MPSRYEATHLETNEPVSVGGRSADVKEEMVHLMIWVQLALLPSTVRDVHLGVWVKVP